MDWQGGFRYASCEYARGSQEDFSSFELLRVGGGGGVGVGGGGGGGEILKKHRMLRCRWQYVCMEELATPPTNQDC